MVHFKRRPKSRLLRNASAESSKVTSHSFLSRRRFRSSGQSRHSGAEQDVEGSITLREIMSARITESPKTDNHLSQLPALASGAPAPPSPSAPGPRRLAPPTPSLGHWCVSRQTDNGDLWFREGACPAPQLGDEVAPHAPRPAGSGAEGAPGAYSGVTRQVAR